MGVQDGLVKCCVSGRRTCPVPVWHERAGQQPGKLSGGRMEKTLEKLTNSVWKGVLLGALVTAAIKVLRPRRLLSLASSMRGF